MDHARSSRTCRRNPNGHPYKPTAPSLPPLPITSKPTLCAQGIAYLPTIEIAIMPATEPHIVFLKNIGMIPKTTKNGDELDFVGLDPPVFKKDPRLNGEEERSSMHTFKEYMSLIDNKVTANNIRFLARMWRHGWNRKYNRKFSFLQLDVVMAEVDTPKTEKQVRKQIENFHAKCDRMLKTTQLFGMGIFASPDIQKNMAANAFNRMTDPIIAETMQYITENQSLSYVTRPFDDKYEQYFAKSECVPENYDWNDFYHDWRNTLGLLLSDGDKTTEESNILDAAIRSLHRKRKNTNEPKPKPKRQNASVTPVPALAGTA